MSLYLRLPPMPTAEKFQRDLHKLELARWDAIFQRNTGLTVIDGDELMTIERSPCLESIA